MKALVKRLSNKISKLSPDQVQNVFTQLVEENDSLLSVIESLSTGLVICDKNWKLLQSNKAGERFLPLTSRYYEIKQQDSSFDDEVWNFVDDEEIANFLQQASKEKKINISEEFVTKTPAGLARFLNISLMPLVQNKKLSGSIIKIDDITEKRNQETLLHRMENLASLTNLAASVAHEIKNPLGSISIYIQLLQKAVNKSRNSDEKLPEKKFLENYIEIINQEIDRLNNIIVDFLFAVRPISAELIPENPVKLLNLYVEFFKPELEDKNINLKTAFLENSPKILLDEKLFKQVLINLVQNAIVAMPDGGELFLSTRITGDKYLISVADTGIGMNSETVSRIFEPYFTTKATGTGLGLTMVYKVIKEFGGDIEVESYEGKGTIFTISLPIPQKEKHLLTEI
ncbi:MAG: ATP-binding protein [Treponemataceae bacterium]|nr:ATP-binding protein [Treponemataceae bacterium]